MEKASEDIVLAIIVASIILVILAVFTTLFFLVFVRKKRIMEQKRQELQRNFDRQLLETKLEIQNQTLENISKDLHDNIGQVLSFVKLSLSMSIAQSEAEKDSKIAESIQLIASSIVDLRDLSKSMSFERLKQVGLAEVIRHDAERINRSGMVKTHFEQLGDPVEMPHQTMLIIYRIFQELTNNTLKHAFAKRLLIDLSFKQNELQLRIADDGVGFNNDTLEKWQGLGLENIQQRAALIGARVALFSTQGAGCTTTLSLKL
ncbi:sensor histidine kinase [Pedobacter sp. MW01-1-1]|uniref:sensor histidine kinase n=1 Tax=Pedobacter sp. MW01-1-1 TaxID=3383027 RepID=UPI003FF06A24